MPRKAEKKFCAASTNTQGRIFLQFIDIVWDKRSRNPPNATMRNKLPRAFNTGWIEATQNKLIDAECYTFDVRYGCAPLKPAYLREKLDGSPSQYFKGIYVDMSDVEPRIRYTWSPQVGAPERRVQKSFKVKPNTWIRIRSNGRQTSIESYWWYTLRTANIAYWTDDLPPPLDLFLTTKPSQVFEDMAILR